MFYKISADDSSGFLPTDEKNGGCHNLCCDLMAIVWMWVGNWMFSIHLWRIFMLPSSRNSVVRDINNYVTRK
jgi:hypothetical protein